MSEHQVEAGLVLACADIVGESIVWDEREHALFWIDIVGRRIHRLVPDTMDHRMWSCDEFPTSIGLRADGGAILGLTQRVVLWDYGDEFATIAVPEPEMPGNRLNEGRVAPDGSFWVATMATNLTEDGAPKEQQAKAGRYYRIDPNGVVSCLSGDLYGIPNTMLWPEPGVFLTADTVDNALYRYTVSTDGLGLSGRQKFGETFERGRPDGSCLDIEGGIWTCRVAGGSCLTRTMPDGTLDRIVELPCSWPTSCTFGGDDLATLYVTSARFTMSNQHLAAKPVEGGLFALRPDVTGKPEHRFGPSSSIGA
ncbi:MAG TPA: SMP-30/gluconolactonase/LRE family protein [Rhizobiaceae bacterium]|nr:SMP-30/gluconolactonase/LRE family protein [Rhizobiaceae bacterium]